MALSDVNRAEQLQLERKPQVFWGIKSNTLMAVNLTVTGKRWGKQSSTDRSVYGTANWYVCLFGGERVCTSSAGVNTAPAALCLRKHDAALVSHKLQILFYLHIGYFRPCLV